MAIFATGANANMIINGSFETNGATTSMYNMTNATFNGLVSNVTAYGSAQEIDLITFTSGNTPQHGSWNLALNRQVNGSFDAFSFGLSSGITLNQQYRISFYSYVSGNLKVGYSSNPLTFGTSIATTNAPAGSWLHQAYNFVATSNASYITVECGPVTNGYTQIDNFSLESVPEPITVIGFGIGAIGLLRRRGYR